ncbi:MAG: hypothetical protein Q8909_11925 [Bacteroidota bacterium]|nr:hypothetical protein [Bacteroidota bacterium]
MEKYNSIEHVLENMDTHIVYKTRSSIWTGVLYLISGVLFFVLMSLGSWSPTSIFPHLLLVLGVIASLTGVLKLFMRKSYFVAASNHQRLNRFEIYFDAAESDKLLRLYDNGKVTDIHLLNPSERGGLKIVVMATKDRSLCFSQVTGYVPFEFIPLTAPVQHTSDEAAYLKDLKK